MKKSLIKYVAFMSLAYASIIGVNSMECANEEQNPVLKIIKESEEYNCITPQDYENIILLLLAAYREPKKTIDNAFKVTVDHYRSKGNIDINNNNQALCMISRFVYDAMILDKEILALSNSSEVISKINDFVVGNNFSEISGELNARVSRYGLYGRLMTEKEVQEVVESTGNPEMVIRALELRVLDLLCACNQFNLWNSSIENNTETQPTHDLLINILYILEQKIVLNYFKNFMFSIIETLKDFDDPSLKLFSLKLDLKEITKILKAKILKKSENNKSSKCDGNDICQIILNELCSNYKSKYKTFDTESQIQDLACLIRSIFDIICLAQTIPDNLKSQMLLLLLANVKCDFNVSSSSSEENIEIIRSTLKGFTDLLKGLNQEAVEIIAEENNVRKIISEGLRNHGRSQEEILKIDQKPYSQSIITPCAMIENFKEEDITKMIANTGEDRNPIINSRDNMNTILDMLSWQMLKIFERI